MITARPALRSSWLLMAISLLVTTVVYWHGLYGTWLFDDYPNIVDNHDLQIRDDHLSSLVRAALSSPSSEFKRPLASLTFAANYLAAGLDPFSWKLTNLAIHLLNGLLIYLLSKRLLLAVGAPPVRGSSSPHNEIQHPARYADRAGIVATLIAASWMLLPINLTGVLYVVQRMESLANLFVLTGLLGYVSGRQRMLGERRGGFLLCMASVLVMTALGLAAKETAVMLPLYAFLIEWLVFRFARHHTAPGQTTELHRGLLTLYVCVLAVPLAVGLIWLLPGLLTPGAWSTRDFTLSTRLLSEARIVADYVGWTLAPTPQALSFYHDDFQVSTGWLTPWTTLVSALFLAAIAAAIWWLRRRRPLAALGLALFLGCHLLTGTILPLELIYEHRNYFASFGLLLAVVPLLAASREGKKLEASDNPQVGLLDAPLPLSLPRYVLLGGLLLLWTVETALTANAWSSPLKLAQDLATRAPNSPRAQYELGRTYIIYSHYDPGSVFTRLAYAPLERAMALPESSILPEQALIFMNSRMGLPIKDSWWDSLTAKLAAHTPGVQDESSLAALTQCVREGRCRIPADRLTGAYFAALSHPHPSARLQATYADYAWNVLSDRPLGLRMAKAAVETAPNEPAYRVTETRMLIALGQGAAAQTSLSKLSTMNIGGSLEKELQTLRGSIAELPPPRSTSFGH
jgi:hypothetical protein